MLMEHKLVTTGLIAVLGLLSIRSEAADGIAAGWRHSVAVAPDGAVWTWGENRLGQLGDGSFVSRDTPVQATGPDGRGALDEVVAVTAGMYHTLAIRRDGTIWAWGNNAFGQLGNGRAGLDAHSSAPVQVRAAGGKGYLTDVIAVAGGCDHSVALRRDGTVWAWGSSCQGQLGNGVRDSNRWEAYPVQALGPAGEGALTNVKAIACGAHHTVALREDGTVWTWGSNWEGQLGNGSLGADAHSSTPVQVTGPDGKGHLSGIRAIAAGMYHTLALKEDGTVWAWGYNGAGQLGNNARESMWDSKGIQSPRPVQMVGGATRQPYVTGVIAVAAGFENSYAVDEAGRVWACGWNVYGGLGGALTNQNRSTVQPVKVLDPDGARLRARSQVEYFAAQSAKVPESDTEPPLTGMAAIAAGMYHVLALGHDGTLWAWGHNGFGQVGDGTRADRDAAVRVTSFAASPAQQETQAAPKPTPREDAPPPDANGPGQRRVFNVRGYGARGDGIHLDMAAIQAAIDAAHAGGGVVLFPPGVYRTGTLELKSNVRLHIEEGATILASTNREHYEQAYPQARRAVIFAYQAHNIGISGRGVIDGQGQFCPNRGWRHNIILMAECKGISISDVATKNAGSWTQHYILCDDLVIRGVTVNSIRPCRNNDGIDLSGCQNVLIEGCTIVSDDDSIVIKSQSADRKNRNIRVINNTVYTFASGFKIGTETRSDFENITVEGLRTYGGTAIGIYSVDGAHVNGVSISDVKGEDANCAIAMRLGARLRSSYFAKGEERTPGSLRSIRLANVDITVSHRPLREVLLEQKIENAEIAHFLIGRLPYTSFISGLPEHRISDVVLENIRVSFPGGGTEADALSTVPEKPEAYPAARMFGTLPAWGFYLRHVEGIVLKNLRLDLQAPDGRPPVRDENVRGLQIEGLVVHEGWR